MKYKKAIIKSSIFLIGLQIIDALLFIILLQFCDYFRSEEYSVAKNAPASNCIVLGTSHAQESFIPNLMEQNTNDTVYNFGRARRNVFFNYYLSQYFINEKREINKVIIVVTYNDLRESTRPYMVPQFVPNNEKTEMTLSLLSQKKFFELRGHFYADLYSSSYRMILSRCLSWIKNRKREIPYKEDLEKGFRSSDKHIKDVKEPLAYKKYPFIFYNLQKEYLIKTIKLWKDYGAQVYVVDTPEYIGTRKSEKDYHIYEKLMNSICEIEGAIFKSFNNPDDPLLKNHLYFKDGDWGIMNSHLNRKGAKLFTEKFSHWLSDQSDHP